MLLTFDILACDKLFVFCLHVLLLYAFVKIRFDQIHVILSVHKSTVQLFLYYNTASADVFVLIVTNIFNRLICKMVDRSVSLCISRGLKISTILPQYGFKINLDSVTFV